MSLGFGLWSSGLRVLGSGDYGGAKVIRVFFFHLHLFLGGYLRLAFSVICVFFTRFPGSCHDSGGSAGYLHRFL